MAVCRLFCYDPPLVRFFPTLLAVLVFAGCASALTARLALPDRNTLVRDQLVFHGDFPLSMHHRLFEELIAQRADVCARLALPQSDEPIHVYLFESPERFQDFMRLRHPGFPSRRAFFVETDTKLTIYAQWGERLADDLRHEVTHGYVHAVVPDVPLWLDEGLAKFYEVPRNRRGINLTMLERFAELRQRDGWKPNLRRMEKFPNTYNMSQDDYAEAWAWTHFLVESRPECLELVRRYLSDVRHDAATPPITGRLAAIHRQPEDALMEHVDRLRSQLTSAPPAATASLLSGALSR